MSEYSLRPRQGRPTKTMVEERQALFDQGLKRCSHPDCTVKPMSDFWNREDAWDGKQNQCKECMTESMDPWQW